MKAKNHHLEGAGHLRIVLRLRLEADTAPSGRTGMSKREPTPRGTSASGRAGAGACTSSSERGSAGGNVGPPNLSLWARSLAASPSTGSGPRA
eukprot:3601175-Pleurochrysis_carterae.AAC.1